MVSQIIKKLLSQIRVSLGYTEMQSHLKILESVAIENLIQISLRDKKYLNKKRLNPYEYKVFSQFGEDGIIQEIFSRIGTKNRRFVEIGSADGLENNTTHLLVNGWSGLWVEGDSNLSSLAQSYFKKYIIHNKLKVDPSFVTKRNIVQILKLAKTPTEFDFLSIDIDGNDYWIWDSLDEFNPRVVAIEYNASLGPSAQWVMKYDEEHVYDYTNYHGASLKSLELLGKKKGYKLVACSLAGVNSFFVREDLVKENFIRTFTSEYLYESPKYFLYRRNGHPMSTHLFEDFIFE